MEDGILVVIHLLGAIIWIGGMFYSLMVLVPSVQTLETTIRIRLLEKVIKKFFLIVWVVSLITIASGWGMIFSSEKKLGWSVHSMLTFGHIMLIIFFIANFLPLKRLKEAVKATDLPKAASSLKLIRLLILINLILGFLLVIAGVLGRDMYN